MSNVQTSNFVKKLAANDRRTREAAIESLKKFLIHRSSALSLLELEKLWKGLFFAMWFSDKPRPQQRLANNLGLLYLDTIPSKSYENFFRAFWVIIVKEWEGIDHHRLDKFLLLIRRVVYYALKRVQQEKWNKKCLASYIKVLKEIPLSGDPKVSTGLPYHLIDIFLDELERVMFEDLAEEDDENDDKKDSELEAQKTEIISGTPIKELIQPFEILQETALLKTLREKIDEDFIQDPRLVLWGIHESAEDDENEAQSSADESETEWNGFD